jgi:hypothetical protein
MDQSSSKQKQTIAATALVADGIFSQPLLSDIATSTQDICEEHGICWHAKLPRNTKIIVVLS